MPIPINQPIIRAERKTPELREIVHCRQARIDQLTAAYAERRTRPPVTRFNSVTSIIVVLM
jgi:hypothetical protein